MRLLVDALQRHVLEAKRLHAVHERRQHLGPLLPVRPESCHSASEPRNSRAQALLERAVLPVTFGALDGEARWRDEDDNEIGPHRLDSLHPDETTRPALFTALRTGFVETLLREAFIAIRDVRAGGRSVTWTQVPRHEGLASCWWWRRIRQRPSTTSA
jgi:hypothetical protein